MSAARQTGVATVFLAACLIAPAALFALPADTQEMTLAQARPQGAPKTIVFRENAVSGKTVTTDAEGLLQILFADGTTLTLGPSSEVTIDSFTFDPEANSATLAATLTRGVFRLIGGRTTKTPNGVAFTTPFGVLAVDAAGADMSLGEASGPAHFDMVYGSGSMTLRRGTSVLGSVHRAGYSIVPSGNSAAVKKTPAEWRIALQELLSARMDGEHQLAAALGVVGRPEKRQW